MKIFKMIRGFFLKWSRSSKIMQNVVVHVKLYVQSLTLNHSNLRLSEMEYNKNLDISRV